MIPIFEKEYQARLNKIVPDLRFAFSVFPKRRERHLHIGLLSYGRKMKKMTLPRAITFTGSFYSIGVPPEFLGVGAFGKLKNDDFVLLNKYYKNYVSNLKDAGKYLNWQNLKKLGEGNNNWLKIEKDIKIAEEVLKIKFGPQNKDELEHQRLTKVLLNSKNNPKRVQKLINQTGVLRKSLG